MSDRIKTAQKPPPGTRKARRARGRGSFSPCETPLLELLPAGQARQRVARKKAPAEVTGALLRACWMSGAPTGAGRGRGSPRCGPGSRTGCRCSRRCGGQRSACSGRGCGTWGTPKPACRPLVLYLKRRIIKPSPDCYNIEWSFLTKLPWTF